MELSILWASTHTAMSFEPHSHSFYQLILCKKPGGSILLGNISHPAEAHRLWLVKPNVRHGITQDSLLEILEVKFDASGFLAQQISCLPEVFSLEKLSKAEELLDRVSQEQSLRLSGFDSASRCALELFFISLFREYGISAEKTALPQEEEEHRRENGDRLILQLKGYMEAHIQEALTLEALAEAVHFNKTYFVQRFKSLWGIPPMKYLTNLRCQKARRLLLESRLSIAQIARETGFQSPHYFSAVFRKSTGVSPAAFRKAYGKKKDA